MGLAELFGFCMAIGAAVGMFLAPRDNRRDRHDRHPVARGRQRRSDGSTTVYIVGSQIYIGDPSSLRALRELDG